MKYGSMVLALLLFAGFAFAIQPAENWNLVVTGKFSPAGAASHTTEGGNVTGGNLYSNVSTEKWAGYYGNVTGEIVLAQDTPATNIFYQWSWDPTHGGEVCAVAGTTYDWLNRQVISNVTIDNIWGFDSMDTDSANNTFADSVAGCAMDIGGIVTLASAGVTTLGAGNFLTCAFDDGGAALPEDVAFCVEIQNAGGTFDGDTGDYQLLVATNETIAEFETYYFWVELD